MKKRATHALLLITLMGVAPYAQAAGSAFPTSPSLSETFGVQIKNWRTTPDTLQDIRDAGFGYVRWGLGWQGVEPTRGNYDWSKSDKYIQEIRDAGLKSVVIIGGGNPAYSGYADDNKDDNPARQSKNAKAPQSDEEFEAFGKYVSAIAERYKGDDITWEIWNEPDSNHFWAPHFDGNGYARAATVACQAIRAVDPNAKIIAPALSNFPSLGKTTAWGQPYRDFIATLLASPAGKCLNAISVHPYQPGNGAPEVAMDQYAAAKAFVNSHLPAGVNNMPIVDSEWGYTTASGEGKGNYPSPRVSADEQGDYVIRQRLTDLMSGVPLSIWYEWQDSYEKPDTDPEARFGLHQFRGQEKPALARVKEFMAAAGNAHLESRIKGLRNGDYAVILQQPDGKRTLAYWTSNKDSSKIYADGNKGTELTLTWRPQLYDLKGNGIPSFAPQPH